MKPLAQNTLIQNRYLIVHLIGKGGMGEVYLAVDQRLGSAVALKRTFFAGDEMLSTAFEREARILARMRHPVLPKVSDHFSEGEEQYLVMEHISGDDLAKRLESAQKPFPLSWVMFWADQLLDALSYLHSHEPPIIHRDIKPQNLKLTDENHVILLDFGLSKNSTGQTKINDSGSTGSVVGYTPHYAPMEQIRGIGTSPKSDIYSLSATLFQLLTNTVPPDALSRADTMLNGSPDPIKSPSELNTEIPPPVSVVLLNGMEVSQEKRFASARDMQKALRKAYAQMQDAMSANTVVMSAEGTSQSDSIPVAVPSMDKTEVMDFDANPLLSQPTEISGARTSSQSATNIVGVPDQGANIQPEPESPAGLQSDVKTEVFLAGGVAAFATPHSSETVNEAPASADFGMTEDFRSDADSFSPDSTTPIVAFDSSNSTAEVAEVDNYYTSPSVGQEQTAAGFESAGTSTNGQESHEAFVPVPAAVAAKKKGSGGKVFAIIAGVLALFVLGIAALGGGWYYYTNYYAGTVVPEASPSPSVELTPEPTIDFAATSNGDNSNADTSSSSNTNTNSAEVLTVAPTPEPVEVSTPEQTATTRPTPQTTGKKPVTSTPTAKATPKPTSTRDRKIILQ